MSLEDELNIPQEATLTLSPQYNLQPIELILSPTIQQNDDNITTNFITIPSSSTTTNQTNSHKVQITNASSIRHTNNNATTTNNNNIPRCIIIGRQASASDIRIDHKSVSRRHTALYYIASPPSTSSTTNTSNTNNNTSNTRLIIQDLGGKHGTYVNDTRLSKNGTFSINLSTPSTAEEYRIRIGNAPLLCRLILQPEIDIDTKMDENKQKCDEKKKKDEQKTEDDVAVDYDRKEPPEGQSIDKPKALPKEDDEDEALTRESREKQIAAMIASFDTAPAYKKYVPTTNDDEDDDDDNVTRGMNNLKTDGKVSMKNEGMATSSTNNTNNNNNPYNLPITSSITLSPGSNSFTSSDGTNTPLQSKSSVSTLCFEPSGARLVAGHRDGTLRFYDFHGMQPTTTSESNTYPPFRIVDSDNDPLDQTGRHIMTALSPSATGGQWIVGNTSAQAKVLDREGQTTLYYFIKGDVYVTDPTKTTGHTASVTGVSFHPLIKDICWTTGLDGSIRQWDTSGKGRTQFQKLVCKSVIGKVKNDKGQRTQVVSNLSVHPNGRKLVIGTSCGSIQIWNCYGVNVNVNRPLGVVYSAHGGESGKGGVTFVTFSGGNGEYIASRSDSDDTVRIWNVGRMEKDSGLFSRKHNSRGSGGKGGGEVEHSSSLLLAVCVGLPALNEFANCAFSPDGTVLCAGTSIDPRKSGSGTDTCGKLKFYKLPEDNVKRIKGSISKEGGSKSSSKKNKKTTAMLDPIVELDVAPNASVLGVQWHPKLNQIAIGTSNGIIQVLYDPILSNKGALLPASRTVRKSDGLSDLLLSRAPTGSAAYLSSANNTIMNPHSLPLFREEPKATKKMKDNDRKDPEKTKMPEAPISGGTRHSRIKTGAQVGGGTTFIQHTLEATNYNNNKNIAGKDPREELFKYSEGKSYVSKAYEGDVQRILAEKTVEEEEADLKGGNSSKRQRTK